MTLRERHWFVANYYPLLLENIGPRADIATIDLLVVYHLYGGPFGSHFRKVVRKNGEQASQMRVCVPFTRIY